jgi:hypothetical protein
MQVNINTARAGSPDDEREKGRVRSIRQTAVTSIDLVLLRLLNKRISRNSVKHSRVFEEALQGIKG